MVVHLGDRIKKLRLDQGLSLSELSLKASIAKSHLSNIERGLKTNPSLLLLERIAAALEVPLDVLIESRLPAAVDDLDAEWRLLIHKAVASGISKSQFREFLSLVQKWKAGG